MDEEVTITVRICKSFISAMNMFQCMYVYVCMCMCAWVYVYMCIYVYICVYMRICLCGYVYTRICVCVYVCMRIYVYVYVYICMCIYVYVCTCVYMYICICVYVYICVYVCVCMCIYVCVCMCVCVSMCVHVYVCMCICVYVCICVCVCVYVCMSVCVYLCMCMCVCVCVCTILFQQIVLKKGRRWLKLNFPIAYTNGSDSRMQITRKPFYRGQVVLQAKGEVVEHRLRVSCQCMLSKHKHKKNPSYYIPSLVRDRIMPSKNHFFQGIFIPFFTLFLSVRIPYTTISKLSVSNFHIFNGKPEKNHPQNRDM